MVEYGKKCYVYIYKLYLEILVNKLLVVPVSFECLKVLWCTILWRMISPALSFVHVGELEVEDEMEIFTQRGYLTVLY